MANVNLNSMANLFAKSVFNGSVINANDLQADLKAVVIDRQNAHFAARFLKKSSRRM